MVVLDIDRGERAVGGGCMLMMCEFTRQYHQHTAAQRRESLRSTHKKNRRPKSRLSHLNLSGYQDSNLGPPAPKAGALTGLRYIP